MLDLPDEARKGDWIQTFTGRTMFPLDPRPSEIDIADIAHMLSMQCRFSGATREFYSAAQHAVLLSRAVPSGIALAALHCGSADAYLPSVPAPVKPLLQGFDAVERQAEATICAALGIDVRHLALARPYRARLAEDERAALLARPSDALPHRPRPLGVKIEPWTPRMAEARFLARHGELSRGARTAPEPPPAESEAVAPGWIDTFTGRSFFPLAPQPCDVDIADIAHMLSMKCRYNGATGEFYSVAQHGELLSRAVPADIAYAALHHDDAEAYLPDVPSPVKPSLQGFKAIERRVESAIGEALGVNALHLPLVKPYDARILADERAALLAVCERAWERHPVPLGIGIEPWPPCVAEARFLARHAELSRQCGRQHG